MESIKEIEQKVLKLKDSKIKKSILKDLEVKKDKTVLK